MANILPEPVLAMSSEHSTPLKVLFVDRSRAKRPQWHLMRQSLEAVEARTVVERLPGIAVMSALRLPRVARKHLDCHILISFLHSSLGLFASLFVARFIIQRPVAFFIGGDPFRSTVRELRVHPALQGRAPHPPGICSQRRPGDIHAALQRSVSCPEAG